jgi:hypothetical protein
MSLYHKCFICEKEECLYDHATQTTKCLECKKIYTYAELKNLGYLYFLSSVVNDYSGQYFTTVKDLIRVKAQCSKT